MADQDPDPPSRFLNAAEVSPFATSGGDATGISVTVRWPMAARLARHPLRGRRRRRKDGRCTCLRPSAVTPRFPPDQVVTGPERPVTVEPCASTAREELTMTCRRRRIHHSPARDVPRGSLSTRVAVLSLAILVSVAASAAWATPISDKYAALGGAAGFLGDPLVPETVAPDGVGTFRHYDGGSIYWHPNTGAHEVHGLIRQRWSQLNWEKGYLGYPITDEIDTADGGGRVSRFQGGELIWNALSNAVREVKSSDLVVELPFPAGETWEVIQAHAVNPGDSHTKAFAYCWDFKRAGNQADSNGKPFTAVATGRIVHADESFGTNVAPGNVVAQRLGQSRYATYLHLQSGSYSANFGAPALFLPQALPWSMRPSASTGTVLATMGDSGANAGAYHLHFCVATAPSRPQYEPRETVPVSFRDYQAKGKSAFSFWTNVAQGVPRAGQLLRRQGTQVGAGINSAAIPNGFGTVAAKVTLKGPGRPAANGVITLTVVAPWGEPLRSKTLPIGGSSIGPWATTIDHVPAHDGLTVVATYSGGWNIPTNGGTVGGESSTIDLPADTTANATIPLAMTEGAVIK
jgi:hypothetical protein